MSDNTTETRRLRNPKAAKYLAIAESTLAKLRVFGGGPAFSKAGRAVIYDTRDLDAWLDARKRQSTSETPKTA